jgi:G protein-coupled receptor 157
VKWAVPSPTAELLCTCAFKAAFLADWYSSMEFALLNTTKAFAVPPFPKDQAMRAVVGVSCCLSILGSLLIILSFILFKKRRTRAREILLHISLMDLGVALANLIGLSVYFDRYYIYDLYTVNSSYKVPSYIDGLCKTQAFFAIYCTHASVLWTIALAGFLYFVIVYQKSRIATYFLWSSYIFCYVVPFLVTMWLVLTNKLGYSPFDSSGWCSLILTVAFNSEGQSYRHINLVATIIGYDLWVYLAFITIPIFYFSIRCHLANMVSAMHIRQQQLFLIHRAH